MSNITETAVELATRLAPLVATAEALKARLASTQLEYETALTAIHAVTPTFEANGQWYQVRHRADSKKQGRPITYLCELEGEPKSWLGGKRGPRVVATAEESTETAEVSMAHIAGSVAAEAMADVTGAVVID